MDSKFDLSSNRSPYRDFIYFHCSRKFIVACRGFIALAAWLINNANYGIGVLWVNELHRVRHNLYYFWTRAREGFGLR